MEKRHIPVRTGTLTLLLTVVALCLAVLSVLALATARADLALARKAAGRFTEAAEADAQGQQWLAGLDEALRSGGTLPQGAVRQGGRITAELACSGGTLHIAVQVEEGGWRVTRWQLERPWQPDEELDVWQGPEA